jgi:O-antigen/teichoic acid export membrane protein
MLKTYGNFFGRFIRQSGHKVLSASVLSKALGFVMSIIVIRVLSQEDYGVFSFVYSIIAFILPINGLGLNHSLLRFGAVEKSYLTKYRILSQSFSFGLMVSVIQIVLLVAAAFLIREEMPGTRALLIILAFQLIGMFLIELKKSYARLLHKNNWFAVLETVQVLVYFGLSVFAVLLFGLWGYALAVMLAPLIAFFITRSVKLRFSFRKIARFREHISYGVNIGLGSIASNLLFYTDIILLGILVTDPNEIALYKTASIIPLRLIFIPVAFLSIYYVDLARHYRDKKEIMTVIRHYLISMGPLALLMFGLLYFFGEPILELLFGFDYKASKSFFMIFVWVIPASFFLRALFGNVLAALGKSGWNARVSWLILILNIPLNYWAIKSYGTIGAAYVTVGLIAFSGLLFALLFLIYLLGLKKPGSTMRQ